MTFIGYQLSVHEVDQPAFYTRTACPWSSTADIIQFQVDSFQLHSLYLHDVSNHTKNGGWRGGGKKAASPPRSEHFFAEQKLTKMTKINSPQ